MIDLSINVGFRAFAFFRLLTRQYKNKPIVSSGVESAWIETTLDIRSWETAREAKPGREVVSKGYRVMAIVDLTRLSYQAVRLTIDRYTEGGCCAEAGVPWSHAWGG